MNDGSIQKLFDLLFTYINQTFIFITLQMHDNHLWKLRDNSYNKETYYDERYDQTEETRKEICDNFYTDLRDCDIEHKEDKEANIDNFYNWD